MKFNPKEWCENQIKLARINIQLKFFVEDKAHMKNLWDKIMVGNSFRESAHIAARAQSKSLIEIHKIIPDIENYKGTNVTSIKDEYPLEYINGEVSNNLINEFKTLSDEKKSMIIEHLKDNNYRISILPETMKPEGELEELVREKLKNNSKC